MSEEDKPFVDKVRIQNFGCVRDVTIELTRLHALIGPNDSGKSTVLNAILTAHDLVTFGQFQMAEQGKLDSRGVNGTQITLSVGDKTLVSHRDELQWQSSFSDAGLVQQQPELAGLLDLIFPRKIAPLAAFLRWSPDVIRRPCALIPEGDPLVVGEHGEGLAAIYEAILSRDRDAFKNIEVGLKQHFPTIKAIWLPTSKTGQKELGVILNDDTRVSAKTMSEGLLYWLAFAAIPHMEISNVLLIEEPENGLHPSRIAEVMATLRAISAHTQVILATHSPLVINELQPEEVTILTRDNQSGTRATRMDRTKHFEQRQKVYALGELWLSFADGDAEQALVADSVNVAAS
ncbi:MAG TPA: ATP-binding protein [Kofleriaceae bacterium]|nr:ATP-binding protein [Kofleriaceae bacterium]